MVNLYSRSLVSLENYTPQEIRHLIRLAIQLKRDKNSGTEQKKLSGLNIALIFEKPSTRTRCAFEVAAYDQGANITYLGPTDTHMGDKESIKDTARVLGRYYDGIEFRGFNQETVEILATYANVPVWNGLTNSTHPTQVLADLMTMQENFDGNLSEITCCFLGDGANNVANSLMLGASKMGMRFRIACPPSCHPSKSHLERCKNIAKETGGDIMVTDDINQAVTGCDFLYTDVWVSMGDPDDIWSERIKIMLPFQINKELMKKNK